MVRRIAVYIFLALIIAGVVLGFSYYSDPPSKPSISQDKKPQNWQELAGPPEMSKVDPTKPLRDQTRIFELAGRTFEIPIMYIDGRPKPGEHQESMLLEVIWPEMRSIWELKDRTEYNRIKREEHRIGWILLEPASLRPSLEVQNENAVEALTKFEFIGEADGLDKGRWYRGPEQRPELWAEVYVERGTAGTLVSFIRCRRGPNARFPTCKHKFVDKGLIYQISYNETAFFSEWRQQRQRAIDFVNNFEIQPQSASTKEE